MSDQPTFLYVEDDPMSREVMGMLLRGIGQTHVHILDSSERFLQRVEALPQIPDVIFLDIHMKPFDGFEMLDLLRAHPKYAQKPVIAVTASVMNEEVNRLKIAGFSGAIAKPLDFDNFAELIGRVLKLESIWHIT
jgi:CheY-like chemotaxis protein